ncbi:MAG: GNAT family N-acetyltransferase [SAR202 cluster bacterium]|nr:GNAT family N-acetyltransferase [SAR202 cluster bacterium]
MSSEPGEQRIEIREMEIDDLAAVFHLGERLFTSEDLPILYRTWDAYEITEYFNMDPQYCLVAEAEDQVVGFVLGTSYEKEGSAWKYGYVSWIGVSPDVRRKGLGYRLYRALERRMREDGIRMMLLDTEAGNKPALAFFKRIGFTSRRSHVWLGKTLRRPRKDDDEDGSVPKSKRAPKQKRKPSLVARRPPDPLAIDAAPGVVPASDAPAKPARSKATKQR